LNFKRGKPKNARSGCLMCKPWKANKAKDADTMDVKIIDQPEEHLGGSRKLRRKRTSRSWPHRIPVSCGRCGVLVKTLKPASREEFLRIPMRDRYVLCEKCQAVLKKERVEHDARVKAHLKA